MTDVILIQSQANKYQPKGILQLKKLFVLRESILLGKCQALDIWKAHSSVNQIIKINIHMFS